MEMGLATDLRALPTDQWMVRARNSRRWKTGPASALGRARRGGSREKRGRGERGLTERPGLPTHSGACFPLDEGLRLQAAAGGGAGRGARRSCLCLAQAGRHCTWLRSPDWNRIEHSGRRGTNCTPALLYSQHATLSGRALCRTLRREFFFFCR